MPNYCGYQMRIQGNTHDVEEVIKVIQADYNYDTMQFSADNHLFRVFEADISEDTTDGNYRDVVLGGSCAWSVFSCMMEGVGTYYSSLKAEYGDKFRGTTLVELSKKYNVMIEAYGEESGCEFQEHYLIHNGELLAEDCVRYIELYKEYLEEDETTLEEVLKESGFTMDDVTDEYDYYRIGGFESWDFVDLPR